MFLLETKKIDPISISTIWWISFFIMSESVLFVPKAVLVFTLINYLHTDAVIKRCSVKYWFAHSSKNYKEFLATAKSLKNIFEWTLSSSAYYFTFTGKMKLTKLLHRYLSSFSWSFLKKAILKNSFQKRI